MSSPGENKTREGCSREDLTHGAQGWCAREIEREREKQEWE